MVDEKHIISQCIDLANQVIKKGLSAAISIEIGEGFIFNFDNKDSELNVKKLKKKSPSQEARSIQRSNNFKEKTNDLENKIIKEETIDSEIKVIKEETKGKSKIKIEPTVQHDEIELRFEDSCEKVFVIPKYKGGYIKEKNNDAIEKEIEEKLQENGIKLRKIFIQRDGNPLSGEYNRSIVLIERIPRKLVKDGKFGIENCWVLTDS